MARVLLPCEVKEWWEDKRLFLLLCTIKSVEDLSGLLSSHTRQDSKPTILSRRLSQLSGLVVFLKKYCTGSERDIFMRVTLPFISRTASKLDELVPESGLPIIVQQEAASLVLGRQLVLCLIANAFLCTYPESGYQHIKTFSFHSLFSAFNNSDGKRLKSRAAKIKCILSYFQTVAEERADLSGMITFKRQVIEKEELLTLADWTASQKLLCDVKVDDIHTIESSGSHTLQILASRLTATPSTSTVAHLAQVDFANKKIGGGVLSSGCVQEEIKFCLFPEMLVSLLVMDHMQDNEAIVITGAEQFSECVGYGDTFEFVGKYEGIPMRDVFGNSLNSTVAIDAYPFGKNPEKQFENEMILRELNKAYAGFQCTQDRGDISVELVTLNNPHSSFIAEYYSNRNEAASMSTDSTLDGVSLNYSSAHFEPQIGLKSSLVEQNTGPPSLSPIKKQNESSIYVNLADDIIKMGLHKATNKESDMSKVKKQDSKAVDDFATTMSSFLLNELTSDESLTVQPTYVEAGGNVDRFASSSVDISFYNDIEVNSTSSSSFQKQSMTPANMFATTLVDSLFDSLNSVTTSENVVSDPVEQPSGIDDLTFSLSATILKSSIGNATKESAIDDEKADEIAKGIISDVFSSLQPAPSELLSTKTSSETTNESFGSISNQILDSNSTNPCFTFQGDHPAIFIQVERRGSLGVNESPRSSRSSSLTGQSITVHEFTDDLAENLIRDGLSIAQYTNQSMNNPFQMAGENTEQVAEKVTQSIIESLKVDCNNVQPKTDTVRPKTLSATNESFVQDGPKIPKKLIKSRLLFSKQELAIVAARMAKRGSSNDQCEHSDIDTPLFPGQLNSRLLTPSSSRHSMGNAWSTASTRDDSSRPVSPTDFDRIALGLVSDFDDYAAIFSKILVSDGILSVSGERPKCLHQSGMEDNYSILSMTTLPSENKIDAYFSRLDMADGLLHSLGEEAIVQEPSFQQKIKTALLRPIATGNWGCGAFKGDHQLKCMLQWAVASLCGRPQMIYYTFGRQELNTFTKVADRLVSKGITVGQLCKILLTYASSHEKKKKKLFAVLMET